MKRNIFESVDLPDVIPEHPREMMEAGLAIIELAHKKNKLGVYERDTRSRDNAVELPVAQWERVLPDETRLIMHAVDKRQANAGVTVTAEGLVSGDEQCMLQIFEVNDSPIPGRRGVRRVTQGVPSDIAFLSAALWQISTRPARLPRRSDRAVIEDYAKALSTVFLDD